MNWKTAIILVSVVSFVGCRKDAPEQPPVVPMPAPSAPENIPVEDETSPAEDKTKKNVESSPVETRDRLPTVALPKAPDMPLELLATQTGNRCRPNDSSCPDLGLLAARLETDLPAAKTLLASGTDQQKTVLMQALLRTRSVATDDLLIENVMTSNGQLNQPVLEVLAMRRSAGAVQTLTGLLGKTMGASVVALLDTLSRIGTTEASQALVDALKNKRLRPYWGAACRGISRVLDVGAISEVTRLGAALNATDRQAEGCRGAETALRMYQSSTRFAVNVGPKQKQSPRVAVRQMATEPNALRISVVFGQGNPCEATEEALQLRMPLDRNGEPIVGQGVVPEAMVGGQAVSRDFVYMLRFDQLTLKRDTPVSGSMHVDFRVNEQPRIIATGSFDGAYCGVK